MIVDVLMFINSDLAAAFAALNNWLEYNSTVCRIYVVKQGYVPSRIVGDNNNIARMDICIYFRRIKVRY